MDKVTKPQSKLPALVDNSAVESFQMLLNKAPDKSESKTNKFADNSQYIPIGIIERKLDEIYSGLWSTTGHTRLEGNSIVAEVTLRVFHPTAKTWITRMGVGAIPVQLNKGEKVMSFETTKSDAFRKGCPAAKSQALRNAAQSLGEFFGRSLNREIEEYDMTTLSERVTAESELQIQALELLRTSALPTDDKAKIEGRINRASVEQLKKWCVYLEEKQG